MALSTQQKLDIASISEYLSAVDIKSKGLFGGGVPIDLPDKIYKIRKSIAYWYALDPTDTTLVSTSNYLLALCGLYGLEAQGIVTSAGTIATVSSSSSTIPLPLQFIVAASGNSLNNGDTGAVLTSFIGYNLLFARGGVAQSTVVTEPSYYSWSRTTGILTVSPAVSTGELIQIYPV